MQKRAICRTPICGISRPRRGALVLTLLLAAASCLPATRPVGGRQSANLGREVVVQAVAAHGGLAAYNRCQVLHASYTETWWPPYTALAQSPWPDNPVHMDLTVELHADRAAAHLGHGLVWWWNGGGDVARTRPGAGDPAYALPRTSFLAQLPFKFLDPGASHTYLGRQEVEGTPHDVVLVAYTEVGNSPHDRFWAYFDATTHRLRRVFLTVTAYHPLAFGAVNYRRLRRVGPLWLATSLEATYPLAGVETPLHSGTLQNLSLVGCGPAPL